MKQLNILTLAALMAAPAASLRADEGQWLPMLIDKNIAQMQQMGCRLDADDIYSLNHTSLKDAVVIFGRGCTGEMVSDSGLLLTNYHCGYDAIQYLSTVEHDYLTDGFWATGRSDELPVPGLTVTFLISVRDVTDSVTMGLTPDMPEREAAQVRRRNIELIERRAAGSSHYTAAVKPFFNRNQYLLFVNEVFTDVRLVGAPPSRIGKFGGDTDNWVWPRQTGDFSMFRVYAGADNRPAPYSAANRPYRPRKHLTISTRGVHEGDFTMVMGYPGTTNEYAPSHNVAMTTRDINPRMIELRTAKLDVMNRHQKQDPAIRIKYDAKNASTSNAWKKWQGENTGLAHFDAIGKKQAYEARLTQWIEADSARRARYGSILPAYAQTYPRYAQLHLADRYYGEMCYRGGIETMEVAAMVRPLIETTLDGRKPTRQHIDSVAAELELFYKDYDAALDREMSARVLECYLGGTPAQCRPATLTPDSAQAVALRITAGICADRTRMMAALARWNRRTARRLAADPAMLLLDTLTAAARRHIDEYRQLADTLRTLDRLYMKAQMDFEPDRHFYPDANFTMRVAYGTVCGYTGCDGTRHDYFTTLDQIMEKNRTGNPDFDIPERLAELHRTRDYGSYAEDGQIRTCFVANNHTTGGNSGSPVLNADGHLVGLNFDRAWDGIMSDTMFAPAICRNITLDIRYLLFVVDRYAGAGYLLREMTFAR